MALNESFEVVVHLDVGRFPRRSLASRDVQHFLLCVVLLLLKPVSKSVEARVLAVSTLVIQHVIKSLNFVVDVRSFIFVLVLMVCRMALAEGMVVTTSSGTPC